MNRKLIAPLVLAILFIAGCADLNKPELPNIVFILADDLGYGEIGAYGQRKIETPNIDKLAEGGMVFTQHYSGSPVCAPSRCVLLTGLHSGHAYIRGNDEWGDRGPVWDYREMLKNPELEGQRPLPEGTQTVGRLLQDAGYRTAVVGKWGLGAPGSEGVPNRQGFDFFFGYNCQRQAHTYTPVHLWKNDKKVILNNDTIAPGTKYPEGSDPYNPDTYAAFWQEDYSPDLMFEEIQNFVSSNNDNPFFLYWATPIPHVAIQSPPEWVDYYVDKLGDEEPYDGSKGYFPHRYPRAGYAGMVSYLDNQVGLLIKQLKELGLYENTIIFFSSDNGPSYAGGTDSEYFNSAGPFPDTYGRTKGFVYEGGIRVPMLVNWPGRIKEGSRTDHISAFWDVLPTLCDLAGINPPEETDGISFLPTLLGETRQPEHDYLYWEFPSYQGQQAVRMGKWKGVRKDIFKGNMEIELYDLEADPAEQVNVADQHPDVVSTIRQIFSEGRETPALERFKIKELGDR